MWFEIFRFIFIMNNKSILNKFIENLKYLLILNKKDTIYNTENEITEECKNILKEKEIKMKEKI